MISSACSTPLGINEAGTKLSPFAVRSIDMQSARILNPRVERFQVAAERLGRVRQVKGGRKNRASAHRLEARLYAAGLDRLSQRNEARRVGLNEK